MNDIDYCTGDGCEIKSDCLRYRLSLKHTSGMKWYVEPLYETKTKQCENFFEL